MSEITLVEAVNQALAYEMRADKNVVLLGEDIAKKWWRVSRDSGFV